ncbi:MAG: DUF6602 domain-containing protein [Candidatus Shapirobacteria bacterium]
MKKLFSALDEEMSLKLSSKIDEIHHPVAKGNETELNWIGLLKKYLPERYKVDSGFVVDHEGSFSDQIDLIIYDRHFTPFIFRGENVAYIPAEGVYAVFEIKPDLNKTYYDYAVKKLNSVKGLKRTSSNFTHIMGNSKKDPSEISGGILTKKISSQKFFNGLKTGEELSFVLCLDCGVKIIGQDKIEIQINKPILAFFLLKLIEKLRSMGSVSALDVDSYLEQVRDKPEVK